MRHTCYLLGMALALIGATASYAQDQPAPSEDDASRGVARLSIVTGEVYIQRGDASERSSAIVNAPLMAGDIVGTGANGRAEVQFDSANLVRLGANAEVRLSELTRSRYQLQVGRGTVLFSVIREPHAQVEISTPQVSVRPTQIGAYRITVHEDGQAEITPRLGEAEIYTPRGVETVKAGGTMMVRGTSSDPEFQNVEAIKQDEFDHWNAQRDDQLKQSTSYQHVSPDINGSGDLDNNGRWVQTPDYGSVWAPNQGPDWAPYRNGQWVWEDWYGWTWVSYDPWGWAPYHYGRWFFRVGIGWAWYPGPVFTRCYWSPALVGFFGFGGGLGFGWVPLAPFEVIHPWWGRGFYGGFSNRNVLAGRVNVVNNVNIYNAYRNARITNGVTGVGSKEFANGRFTNTMAVNPAQLRQATLVRGQVPIAPTSSSLRLSDRPVTARSTTNFNNTRFFSHNQPAAVNRVPFSQQQRSLGQATSPSIGSRTTTTANTPAAAAAGNSAWRRFGGPAESSATHGSAAAPATNRWNTSGDRPATASSSGGWRRYQPGTEPSNSRYSSSPGYGSPRSLQIAPPIVRERSAPAASSGSAAPSGGAHSSSPSASSASSHASSGGGGHSSGGGGGGHGHR
jgi:hypothetical protein